MANSFVIIPTHNRINITTININLLLSQAFEVVIVVSTRSELLYYSEMPVHVVMAPNNPLGAKFQAGVDYAKNFDPDCMITLGSDDLLSNSFKSFCELPSIVEVRCGFLKSDGLISFTGFNQWYIRSNRTLYHLEYLAEQPLGGGRIFPKVLLKILDYKLFDTTKNRLLDDHAWNKIKDKYGQRIINEPHILAVKGDWPVMNELNLKHQNVKLLNIYEGDEALKIMKERFNYDPKGIL
jgi:glycosyltransferase involved in cell wall biosynthesis